MQPWARTRAKQQQLTCSDRTPFWIVRVCENKAYGGMISSTRSTCSTFPMLITRSTSSRLLLRKECRCLLQLSSRFTAQWSEVCPGRPSPGKSLQTDTASPSAISPAHCPRRYLCGQRRHPMASVTFDCTTAEVGSRYVATAKTHGSLFTVILHTNHIPYRCNGYTTIRFRVTTVQTASRPRTS